MKIVKRVLEVFALLSIMIVLLPSTADAAGNVTINTTNFPDPVFRAYVIAKFSGGDSTLTPEEIDNVTSIYLYDSAQYYGNGNTYPQNLKGIEYFTALTQFDASQDSFIGESIDLHLNTELVRVDCGYNSHLTNINVSGCSKLKRFYCDNCSISSINVSGCTSLVILQCHNNALKALDLNGLSSLETLQCAGCAIKTLNLSGCDALSSLYCGDNSLTTLDLSGKSELRELLCENNALTSLDLTEAPIIMHIKCDGNPGLLSIDITDYFNYCLKARTVSGNAVNYDDGLIFGTETTVRKNGIEIFHGRSGHTVTTSGSCGNTAYWEIWEDGVMSISGTGITNNYETSNAEWTRYKYPDISALEIGEGITKLGDSMFHNCAATSLLFRGDTEIGQWTFNNASIQSIDFGSGNVNIGYCGFTDTEVVSLNLTPNVTITGMEAFSFCDSLTSVVIGFDGPLPNYTFEVCYNLRNIEITGKITSIGSGCFRGALGGCSVILPISVTQLDPSAFNRNYNGSENAEPLKVLQIENPLLEMDPSKYWLGLDTATTTLKGPACSKVAAFAQKKGFNFEATDSSEHTIVTTEGKPATCTEDGFTESKKCSVCGLILQDQETIPALGHLETSIPSVYPTCTEAGLTEGKICSRCNEVLVVQEEIQSLGHDYIDTVTAPLCTERGYTTHTCSRCSDSYVDSYVDALGHDLVAHEGKEATCTEAGWKPYETCKRCDYSTYEVIPVAEHKPEEPTTENEIEPTCTAAGSYDEVVYCEVCGEELSRESKTIKAPGHSWSDWVETLAPTCTEKGKETRTCSRCNTKNSRETVALGHDYVETIKAPLCTEQGYTTHTCSRCSDSYVDSYVDALGHDFVTHESKEATCTEAGWKPYETCKRCDYTTYEEIPATGHKWNRNYIVDKEPTYTEEGSKSIHCSICDTIDENTKTTIPKKDDSGNILPSDNGSSESIPGSAEDTSSDTTPAPTDNTEPEPTQDPVREMGKDGTAMGVGASAEAAEAALTSAKGDIDLKGSVYNKLQLKQHKVTKTSITMTWKKIPGAKKYIVFAGKSGKSNKLQKITTTTKTKYTLKKFNKKKLAKGTYYKFAIIALDGNGKVVTASKFAHVATLGKNVMSNPATVTTKAKKDKVTIKAKKTFKLAGAYAASSKKLKIKKVLGMRYESTNTKVATVSSKGVIKGVKKGTCYVYAYAQNGLAKKIKVTVK